MKTATIQNPAPDNIVPLPVRKRSVKAGQQFNVVEFTNKSGTTSWRVDGYKRDRTRIRENFSAEAGAKARQNELETEWLKGHTETGIRATTLTAEQIELCQSSVRRLGDDWPRMLDAVIFWQQQGKQASLADSPRIDDAVEQYVKWLDDSSGFREATRKHWKIRIGVFKNGVFNVKVSEVTPDFVAKFIDGLAIGTVGKDTYRRAVSRFFSWCIEKKWIAMNPARRLTKGRKLKSNPPAVLTVKQCKALLKASAREGLAPYVAVCMFGGVRPYGEASRLTWSQVNLKDREIRLEGTQTKTGAPRVVVICDTLAAWLQAYEGKPFYPANWRRKFKSVRQRAKITSWPKDVLRHTAISHYFRNCGSYGRTAEQFGNSETIIKSNYQGRVISDDTKKFYALRPAKGAKK